MGEDYLKDLTCRFLILFQFQLLRTSVHSQGRGDTLHFAFVDATYVDVLKYGISKIKTGGSR